jgi:predicted RNA-binding protein with PIN domain
MMYQKEEWLVVDGYNVIGVEKKLVNLDEERDRLIRDLSEYQAVTGRRVFLVFDAHQTPGIRKIEERERVTVIFTQHEETADEFIEQFVRENKNPHRNIYVATSDYLEQRMIFGQGAYRISSRELLQEIRIAKEKLEQKLEEDYMPKKRGNKLGDRLSTDLLQKLEKLRRKK